MKRNVKNFEKNYYILQKKVIIFKVIQVIFSEFK